jgi:hypothetical protein
LRRQKNDSHWNRTIPVMPQTCKSDLYRSFPHAPVKKKTIKPRAKDLSDEIGRRSGDKDVPRCTNWRATKIHEWLTNNPITGVDDMAFLLAHVVNMSPIK